MFQAKNTHRYGWSTTGMGDIGFGLAPGTSPSITSTIGCTVVVAFQTTNGHLWVLSPRDATETLNQMMPRASPSITVPSGGGYEVAFQANTTNLETYSRGPGVTDTGDPMAPGISPNDSAGP